MTVVTTLVALLVAVTDTPGINAPVASDTDPLSDALLDCPNDSVEKPRHSSNTVAPAINVEDFPGCMSPPYSDNSSTTRRGTELLERKLFFRRFGGITSPRATDVNSEIPRF